MNPTSKVSGRFVALALILAATLAATRRMDRRAPEELAKPLSTIAGDLDGWRASGDDALRGDVLEELRPTEYLSRVYRRGEQSLSVFIAYYAQQRAGESMHSPRNCLPASGWEPWDYRKMTIPVAGGRHAVVNAYRLQNGDQKLLVLYWYQSRLRIHASEYAGKLFLIRDAVVEGRTAGSLVRITVPDKQGASETAAGFAAALIPQVQQCLGGAEDRT